MANGELCIHCGDQETPHVDREYSGQRTCFNFVSEFTHQEDCPVLGCNGNCATTIKHVRWLGVIAEHRTRNAWFLHRGQIVFVDIGS